MLSCERPESHGSEFQLHILPKMAEVKLKDCPASPQQVLTLVREKPIRILWAEDNQLIVKGLRNIISQLEVELRPFFALQPCMVFDFVENGRELADALTVKENEYDLIFTDQEMPIMNGTEAQHNTTPSPCHHCTTTES